MPLRDVSSVGLEHYFDRVGVTGSSPVRPTKNTGLMAEVYILYSPSLDRFYTGSCEDFQERLGQHLSAAYPQAFTAKAQDWSIYLLLDQLTYSQARSIETHIKRMKSKKYITDLKQNDSLRKKIINLYRSS